MNNRPVTKQIANKAAGAPSSLGPTPASVQSPSRRRFLKRVVRGGIGALSLGMGSLLYSHEIEPGWVEIEQVALVLPRLQSAFNGFRIAQISDIHLDSWMTPARLEGIVELVNAQQPDIVALTGDFVTHSPQRYAAGLAALRRLRPRQGAFAVLGNHDHWSDAGVVRRALHASGVIELNNTLQTLRRGPAMLHIAGVDDPWMQKDDINVVLRQIPQSGAAVLLAHEPDFADRYAATHRFDLQLSGHSHGGQIVPPFCAPPILPPHGRKYPAGLYRTGSMQHYTNRGVGMTGLHLRFNCRPEITIFTLHAAVVLQN